MDCKSKTIGWLSYTLWFQNLWLTFAKQSEILCQRCEGLGCEYPTYVYMSGFILISGGSLEFNIHQRWWRKIFWHSLVAWLANIFDVHRLQLRKMIQFDEHALNLNHLLVVYVGLLYGNFSRRNKGHWWTSMVIDGQNVEERWWIQYKYLWHHYWMSIRNVELVIRFWGCEDD